MLVSGLVLSNLLKKQVIFKYFINLNTVILVILKR